MIYESSAAYSFGSAKKTTYSNFVNKSQMNNPGPTHYNPNILSEPIKGTKFSTIEKLKVVTTTYPDFNKYSGAQEGTFGKGGPKYTEYIRDKETEFNRQIRLKKKETRPGPGLYQITNDNLENTVKKRTISQKFSNLPKNINYDNKVPGVGKYDLSNSMDFGRGNSGKFTMSKAKRNNFIDDKKRSSSVKHRNDILALDPGYYDIKSDFGNNSVKFTIKGKPKDDKPSGTPGPGWYYQDKAKLKSMRSSSCCGMGYGKKKGILDYKKITTQVPGPGAYTIDSDFNVNVNQKDKIKAHTFGKTPRMNSASKTPGPGFYKIPCSFANTTSYSNIVRKFPYV